LSASGPRAWSKNRSESDEKTPPEGPALSPALERRVDAELAQFDS
jgi:hypothetical protein